MTWNFNMDEAPKGHFKDMVKNIGGRTIMSVVHVPEPIIAAGSNGVVTVSKWIDAEKRWNMFSKDCPPIAWMPWPDHPEGAA